MSTTAFSGPVATFTHQPDGTSSGYSDQGLVVLGQTATLLQNGADTNVNAIIYLPANAQITDFLIDNLTQWDSATSATLSIGTAASGTQYVGSINTKSAGRQAPSYSSAQLTAMANVAANVGVFITVTVVGATTAGKTLVTVRYIQN
jgi:hypothetical protein